MALVSETNWCPPQSCECLGTLFLTLRCLAVASQPIISGHTHLRSAMSVISTPKHSRHAAELGISR